MGSLTGRVVEHVKEGTEHLRGAVGGAAGIPLCTDRGACQTPVYMFYHLHSLLSLSWEKNWATVSVLCSFAARQPLFVPHRHRINLLSLFHRESFTIKTIVLCQCTNIFLQIPAGSSIKGLGESAFCRRKGGRSTMESSKDNIRKISRDTVEDRHWVQTRNGVKRKIPSISNC